MAEPWESYLTAVQALTGMDERLLAKREAADRVFAEQDARARRLEQRAADDLQATRAAISAARADLERIRAGLGVPAPTNDPDHSCTTGAQAREAATAASQWATESDALLASLRRTEERLARQPVASAPSLPPAPTPTRSTKAIWLAAAALLALIALVAVAVALT